VHCISLTFLCMSAHVIANNYVNYYYHSNWQIACKTVTAARKQTVLEYSAPVWHYALTKEQTHQVEKIQKRAIHIIFNFSRGMPYTSMIYAANLNTLASRRNDLSKKFFLGITHSFSCLHHLLPPTRDQSVISRLRTSSKFPKGYTRTKRYCSFINYALNNYQDKL